MYKFDLGHTFCYDVVDTFVKVSCIARVQRDRERDKEREREREVVASIHCNRRVWRTEKCKGSLPLYFHCCNLLSYSVFCNLWAAVVFPIVVGFPR